MCSNRLPTYRSSYRGRYHPYGRLHPRSNCKIDLMKTIDLRFEESSGRRSRASVSLSVVEEEDEDEDEDEKDEEDEDGWEEEYTETASPTSEYQLAASRTGKILVRRRSLTDLVVEFAFAMRRSLQLKKLKFVRSC